MDQECAKPDYPEKTIQELYSQLSLVFQKPKLLWWEPKTRMYMLDQKPKPKEVSWNLNTLLNTVLSKIGMIWKKFGTIVTKTSLELKVINIPLYWLKPLWTPKKTEKKWHLLCLILSKFLNSTFHNNVFYHYMPQEEPQVSLLTLVMELPTLFQFTKDTVYLTLLWELT